MSVQTVLRTTSEIDKEQKKIIPLQEDHVRDMMTPASLSISGALRSFNTAEVADPNVSRRGQDPPLPVSAG